MLVSYIYCCLWTGAVAVLSQEQNLSDINYIMDKLKFRVDYASSQDDEYPASELDTHNPQTKGWQAQRFCEYPQELGLRIDSDRAVIKQIQILSHQFKISKKIELYIGQGSSYQTATFKRLGYMSLDDNTRSNFNARELKSVHIDDAGNFLKLILHQHHQNKPNIHGQVGIVAINLLGYKEGSGGLRDEPRIGRDGRRSDDRSPSSLVPNPLNDLSIDVGLDSHTAEKLRRLAQAKKKAVDEEDYMTAKQIKGVESELMKLGARLNQLDQVKRRAVQDEDYDRAAEIKQEVNGLRAEIEDKIAAICIPGVMDDPEPDYDDRRGRDNRRQGGHNAYSNHGGSGQKKKIINVDDQVVGGAGVYTDAVIDYSGTGNRGDNRGRGKVVQEEEVDFGDHHNYTNNDGSPQNRNSSNNNYNNNHNNNLQYDDDEGDFGPGGGMDTRPIRPKKRDLYDDVDPEMVGEEAAQQQMDQQGNDALFPPGQHPFEGLSNMNDLPPPEQFNAKAREVTDLSKVIDLIGEYRSRALFSTKSIPLREACLLKTRRMLEDGDFQSSPGYSAAIPALMSIIRVGADDRISQVYLSALSLLDTLLPYFKSEGFPKSEFAHLLEPVVATLVEKLNDGTTKIRESAMRMLKSLIGTTVVGPSVIAAQCLRLPGKQKTAWRPVCNRLQLILEIINVNGVSQRSGISVDGVLTFMKNNETFTHSNGEVRDVTKACCIALQRVVGTDAILPQLEPVLRKQQYDDYKIAFGESGGGSSGGGEDRNNGSPETSRSAGGGASHSSPHKSPQKIMQKGQAHEGGSSDDPASYTTCMFCNVHDPTWNEDGLDLHYWKDCTLLTQCPACSQVTEIAGLPQHLTQECEKKNDYVFDELTGLSVKRGEDLGLEPPPTNCAYCPLCIASVEDTDEAWLKHLSQVCPQNKRIVANQTTNDKLSHHADAKRSNSRPGTGRKVDSDAVAGAGMGGGSRPGTGTARPKSAKAVAEQVE